MTHICIIGMGYVGLPLVIKFARADYCVIGIDVDAIKIDALCKGNSYINHIPSDHLKELVDSKKFIPTTDYTLALHAEAIIICVPTPLNKNREPNMQYVFSTAQSIAPFIKPGAVVMLESTTYPGTTDTDLREAIESVNHKQAGVDFHLAYSPEREDPGNPDFSVDTIPKVVGGLTPACRDKAIAIYKKVVNIIIPVANCRVAEAAKLMENIFRSVNIAMVNELKMVFAEMDINIWEVIDAAKTKPFGFMPFYPGPGLGGHCIPIDPFYLTWKAREFNQTTRFIEIAGEINSSMPDYVVKRASEILNENHKPIRGSKILALGVAYKADVDDMRESPSLPIMEKLEKLGASVDYHDPFIQTIPRLKRYPQFMGRQSTEMIDEYDLIVVLTPHSQYRELDFSTFTTPIIDTRNCITNKPVNYHLA